MFAPSTYREQVLAVSNQSITKGSTLKSHSKKGSKYSKKDAVTPSASLAPQTPATSEVSATDTTTTAPMRHSGMDAIYASVPFPSPDANGMMDVDSGEDGEGRQGPSSPRDGPWDHTGAQGAISRELGGCSHDCYASSSMPRRRAADGIDAIIMVSIIILYRRPSRGVTKRYYGTL